MGIENINYKINYEVKIAKDTFWVPIASIGKPKYTEKGIAQFVGKSPILIKNSIFTLYDAIQLFQLSNFKEIDDNKIVEYNSLNWEFHKPGYYSVLTNQGCCASDTSWLLYVLENKYEQIGVVAFIRESGNGHSLNYIKHNGWFYFIDLLSHVEKYRRNSAPETGRLSDFAKSKYNTGIFIKAKRIEDFINYYKRFIRINKSEHLFYSFSNTKACIPVATNKVDCLLECFFPKQNELTIYDLDCEKIKCYFADPPPAPKW